MYSDSSPVFDKPPNVISEGWGKSRCDLPSSRGAARPASLRSRKPFFTVVAVLIATCGWEGQTAESNARPVLLYSRYYNAVGETRYLPDGTYQEILQLLRKEFDVRIHSKPL